MWTGRLRQPRDLRRLSLGPNLQPLDRAMSGPAGVRLPELSQGLLRQRRLPTRHHRASVWDERPSVRDLSRLPVNVPKRAVRLELHPTNLRRLLRQERRLSAGQYGTSLRRERPSVRELSGRAVDVPKRAVHLRAAVPRPLWAGWLRRQLWLLLGGPV